MINDIAKLNELVENLQSVNTMLEDQLFTMYKEKDEDKTSSLVTDYQKSQESKSEAI